MLTILAVTAIVSASVGVFYYMKANEIKSNLKDSDERFKMTFDLLWMEVRDKNELTYNDMGNMIIAMQEVPAYMPMAKQTLAERITGKSNVNKNKLGF